MERSIKKNESKLKWVMAAGGRVGGTARNEAEKAHINNEMAQCSRRWGKKKRERAGRWGVWGAEAGIAVYECRRWPHKMKDNKDLH